MSLKRDRRCAHVNGGVAEWLRIKMTFDPMLVQKYLLMRCAERGMPFQAMMMQSGAKEFAKRQLGGKLFRPSPIRLYVRSALRELGDERQYLVHLAHGEDDARWRYRLSRSIAENVVGDPGALVYYHAISRPSERIDAGDVGYASLTAPTMMAAVVDPTQRSTLAPPPAAAEIASPMASDPAAAKPPQPVSADRFFDLIACVMCDRASQRCDAAKGGRGGRRKRLKAALFDSALIQSATDQVLRETLGQSDVERRRRGLVTLPRLIDTIADEIQTSLVTADPDRFIAKKITAPMGGVGGELPTATYSLDSAALARLVRQRIEASIWDRVRVVFDCSGAPLDSGTNDNGPTVDVFGIARRHNAVTTPPPASSLPRTYRRVAQQYAYEQAPHLFGAEKAIAWKIGGDSSNTADWPLFGVAVPSVAAVAIGDEAHSSDDDEQHALMSRSERQRALGEMFEDSSPPPPPPPAIAEKPVAAPIEQPQPPTMNHFLKLYSEAYPTATSLPSTHRYLFLAPNDEHFRAPIASNAAERKQLVDNSLIELPLDAGSPIERLLAGQRQRLVSKQGIGFELALDDERRPYLQTRAGGRRYLQTHAMDDSKKPAIVEIALVPAHHTDI